MRLVLTALLVPLMASGRDIDSDTANEQVTFEYNKQEIRKAARETGRTARDVAAGVGNVAASAGRAIRNEVGDVDVDVDVRRNRTPRNEAAPTER